jgi:hypothetical protein
MLTALSEAFYSQLISSTAVVLAAVLPTIWVVTRKQNQVHNDNRRDHLYTSELVKDMHTDMGFIKQDVNTIKGDVRSHTIRIGNIEKDLSKTAEAVTMTMETTDAEN